MEDVTGESLLAVLNLLFAHLQTVSIQVSVLDLSAHHEAITVGLEDKRCQEGASALCGQKLAISLAQ